MKKTGGWILKILGGFILLIIILLFTVPILFKDKIRTKVVQVINESVNAKVTFGDYKLGFFKNFPNLAFSLNNVSVVGVEKFENDTLAGFKSFNLVFNLSSLFKKSGYEIKSIMIDRGILNARILKDGSANWDIMKDTTSSVTSEGDTVSSMKVLLKKVEVTNSSISYVDLSSAIEAYLDDTNFSLRGDMTSSETDLQISVNTGRLTFIMDGMKYLNRAVADSKIDMLANFDTWKFTFRKNYLTVNDLRINFTGWFAMPGDDIDTDIKFGSENASFKSLLSLVPSVYMKDYKDLSATGEFTLSGSAKGVYSDADSTMPDVALDFSVNNGLISYPALPEKISNISLKSSLFVDGKDFDRTTVDIQKFHIELAGNPFDMTFALKTPDSDPDFKGSMIGKIDLTALSKAIPMDSITLSGILDLSVRMAGKLSVIEKKQYQDFQASGKMGIRDMLVAMTGYPQIKINSAGFDFNPAFAAMTGANIQVGDKSDFNMSGNIENYIPYFLKNETIKGSLALNSKLVDVTEILSKISSGSAAAKDTASMSVIRVPKNIDFDFNALIGSLIYDKINVKNVKGHIILKNGVLSFRETGMDFMGGLITMDADYDTRDSLKPAMKATLNIKDLLVKDAFAAFNTIQKFAPAASGVDGKVNVQLNYESLLGTNMMPVIKTITGGGKLQSDAVTLLKSAAFDKMKEVLKLGSNYSNTFKNLNVSFKMNDGRLYVSPFDARVGNIKMNIGGDQGLDQTLNYLVKTEIPRSDLGSSVNSLIDNLSNAAAAFGVAFKPADVIKVNVKVTGVFGKPIVTPVFGNSTSESTVGIKETAKESVKQAVTNAVDTEKEKLRKEAEVQGDKLIKEAEAKGQQLRDEAAKAAETIRKEAELQGQNLIKEAEAKGPIAKMAAQKTADALKNEADKKATALVTGADSKANQLIDEAKTKKAELLQKI